ncbi:SET domain-containing protein [uncultured Cytophaga sp.]|uniref:SET domain-containing protein n=1 Tax=uncultured Cytophaga sp. TaxID=160238 RepID=UPI0026132705|nr:SET domain-containing protein [uncultured Cytophaga sp.]
MPDSIEAKEKDYLYIQTSQLPNAGNGLFTSIDIFKDEVISLFKGESLSDKEAAKRAKNKEDGYFINMLDGTILDSKNTFCFAKYANDSQGLKKTAYVYNAEISLNDEEEVCLVALKKIKKGEEIFCSYGKKYWQKFKKEHSS